jgi:LDH2 family malate/lactate/ureidoglycolate dehydrogenase
VTQAVGRLYEDFDHPQDVGHFHLALDPERTVGLGRFRALMDGLLHELSTAPTAPGHDEVLVPGEPEARAHRRRAEGGIPLPPTLWETLSSLGGELGVETPE